ncbi:DNA/RNA helicase, DEAD/DEAH box type domain-containing protein [Rozella allomycis CSF55]|uniref:RNA helicase n=1 Tax=Rozella allomycis (strain CSF55) TaxID=988480 RepID=A0A075APU6_ROZAC|nr:DNA/RNA helicase, DEAD/DEAH box type domain-containing protein [Rozella allomycis CSF55]|eukprot:EPZ32113.1 DNA/RNA helicase, DEAD/DEAH box type domain-containing protein [Rozella allomycis CSF55]
MNFSNYKIDKRIAKSLDKNGFKKPTKIQESVIPLALEGKDILAKSPTGSGKTLSYLLPVLSKILMNEKSLGIILVPTKELSHQVTQQAKALLTYCGSIKVLDLVDHESTSVQKPNLIVSTPSKALPHLLNNNINVREIESLVIDEADLVLSFGYKCDLDKVLSCIPSSNNCQMFLISATLNSDLTELKHLMLKNPAIVEIDETEKQEKLKQFAINCEDSEKYLITFSLFKLKLIKGTCIVFVKDVDGGLKLRLFLEQFGIKCCFLNSELPHKSRYHVIEEFNKGVYDFIIACDNIETSTNADDAGVSRGVDFKNVDIVLNFDFPSSFKSYQHRVGRTARAHASGLAISIVTPKDKKFLEKTNSTLKVYEKESTGNEIMPFSFDMGAIEGFKYRVEDTLKHITKKVIKEAKLKDIKKEILNSEALKSHFDEKPKDLQALRHDKPLQKISNSSHLKNIPGYLLPTKSLSDVALKTNKGKRMIIKKRKRTQDPLKPRKK